LAALIEPVTAVLKISGLSRSDELGFLIGVRNDGKSPDASGMLQQLVTPGHGPGVHVERLKISGELSVNYA